MKVGMGHVWKYKTLKTKNYPNGRFTQYQTKGRNINAPKGSGMGIGSKLKWAINGKFKVYKKGNKWVRITTGTKGQAGFQLPKMRKMKYTKIKRFKGRKRNTRRAKYYRPKRR